MFEMNLLLMMSFVAEEIQFSFVVHGCYNVDFSSFADHFHLRMVRHGNRKPIKNVLGVGSCHN